MPVYNYGHLVANSLQSLIYQTYPNWECIVVDDGSTDNTREVIQEMIGKESRIQYFYQENKGQAAARNRGIAQSRGAYIQFLDADDLIERKKIEIQVAYLEAAAEVDIVYSSAKYIYSSGRIDVCNIEHYLYKRECRTTVSGRGEAVVEELLRGSLAAINSPLVRKRSIEAVGTFDEDLNAVEDWAFWLRCSIKALSFHFLDDPDAGAIVRKHPDSFGSQITTDLACEVRMRKRIHPLLTSKKLRKFNQALISLKQAVYYKDRNYLLLFWRNLVVHLVLSPPRSVSALKILLGDVLFPDFYKGYLKAKRSMA